VVVFLIFGAAVAFAAGFGFGAGGGSLAMIAAGGEVVSGAVLGAGGSGNSSTAAVLLVDTKSLNFLSFLRMANLGLFSTLLFFPIINLLFYKSKARLKRRALWNFKSHCPYQELVQLPESFGGANCVK
tara:strand:- start:199 stop:582 length:384 start_codon:yes stop_codon:yes gene_type:complete